MNRKKKVLEKLFRREVVNYGEKRKSEYVKSILRKTINTKTI